MGRMTQRENNLALRSDAITIFAVLIPCQRERSKVVRNEPGLDPFACYNNRIYIYDMQTDAHLWHARRGVIIISRSRPGGEGNRYCPG